jgi:hypothetical protein
MSWYLVKHRDDLTFYNYKMIDMVSSVPKIQLPDFEAVVHIREDPGSIFCSEFIRGLPQYLQAFIYLKTEHGHFLPYRDS